ncbi:MAG: hypothetical protein IJC15_08345 [Clostridia bacterium]|nr:hypothetical protein [Clostridia bacterium]
MLRTILEVTTALFAVYGIYSAIRALAETCFVPRAYTVAVRVRKGEPADALAARIVDARLALCGGAEPRVILLCEEGLQPDDETLALMMEHGGEVLCVKPYEFSCPLIFEDENKL